MPPFKKIDYFELQAFEKEQMQGKDFSEWPVPAYRQSLPQKLPCHKSPPGSFVSQGGWTRVTGEETKR